MKKVVLGLCTLGALSALNIQAEQPTDIKTALQESSTQRATIHKLLAMYEASQGKDGSLLETVQGILSKESEQQTIREKNADEARNIREKNNNESIDKRVYCGTGILGSLILGGGALVSMWIFKPTK